MHSSNLLLEGLNLMLYGMGIVFIFLTLLVIITSAMSAIVTRFFVTESNTESLQTVASKPLPPEALLDDNLMTLLKMAVERYRQDKQN